MMKTKAIHVFRPSRDFPIRHSIRYTRDAVSKIPARGRLISEFQACGGGQHGSSSRQQLTMRAYLRAELQILSTLPRQLRTIHRIGNFVRSSSLPGSDTSLVRAKNTSD
jgi:hypothetical protein